LPNKPIFVDLKHIHKIMKNILLFISLILIIPTAFSQSNPPRKIKKALEQRAPQAMEVKWSGEGEREKEWTAKYTVGADSLLTKYDFKANWIFTVKFISIDALPQIVTSTILDDYQGATLTKAAEMQEPEFDGYAVIFLYLKDRWVVALTKEGNVYRRKITSGGF